MNYIDFPISAGSVIIARRIWQRLKVYHERFLFHIPSITSGKETAAQRQTVQDTAYGDADATRERHLEESITYLNELYGQDFGLGRLACDIRNNRKDRTTIR